MALWRDRERSSAEVKAITQGHIAELQTKIEELASMQRTLEHLVACCAGDDRPDCPIIDDLSASIDAHPRLKHGRDRSRRGAAAPRA
jgi:MerR family transcriptional regulator, copper efflux regulator